MHAVCPVFWFNHVGAGQNPEVCTLFMWLAVLLAIPVHAFFVFDGRDRADIKRGRHVNGMPHWLTSAFQELLDTFGFRWSEVCAQ